MCVCMLACVREEPARSSCCGSFKCLRGRWSDLSAPGEKVCDDALLLCAMFSGCPLFISPFHHPPPSLLPSPLLSVTNPASELHHMTQTLRPPLYHTLTYLSLFRVRGVYVRKRETLSARLILRGKIEVLCV